MHIYTWFLYLWYHKYFEFLNTNEVDFEMDNNSIISNNRSVIDLMSICNENLVEVTILTKILKALKIIAFMLHLGFFVIVINNKELRTRHMVCLVNLGLISFMYVIYGLITFDSDFICRTQSHNLCTFQAYFSHYCLYLSAFGVLSLAFYRLACVTMSNLKKHLTKLKIIISLLIIWFIPLFTVIIPSTTLDLKISFNNKTSNCRFNYSNQFGYFIAFIVLSNLIPSILIAIIYVTILIKLKLSKKRVQPINCIAALHQYNHEYANHHSQQQQHHHLKVNFKTDPSVIKTNETILLQTVTASNDNCQLNLKQTMVTYSKSAPTSTTNLKEIANFKPKYRSNAVISTSNHVNSTHNLLTSKKISIQTKLALQFFILFLNYELFAISNVVFNVDLRDGHASSTLTNSQLNALRVLIWMHFIFNPIIYLIFHPVISEKLQAFLKHDFKIKEKLQTISSCANVHRSEIENGVLKVSTKHDRRLSGQKIILFN